MAKEWDRFEELWDAAKEEIFRLQLLNIYTVKAEEEEFKNFKEGVSMQMDQELAKWLDTLKIKKAAGVRNINVQVVDLPLTDYLKFEISCYPMQEDVGREIFIIDRKSASALVLEFQDYWMFDRKNIVLMNYDVEGRFKNATFPEIDAIELAGYVRLKDELLKIAKPMREFFSVNDIEFPKSIFV